MKDTPTPRIVDTALGPVAVEARDCPACGTSGKEAPAGRFSQPPWFIKHCPDCGFVFLDPVPSYEALNETLSWEKSYAERRQQRRGVAPPEHGRRKPRKSRKPKKKSRHAPTGPAGWRDPVARLVRHAPPGNIVDVGCADGGRLLGLPEGYVPYGIEVSRELADEAAYHLEALGGDCVHAPALDGLDHFADGFFTGALLRSYLEHEVRPDEVLEKIAKKLRPDGAVIVKVPNYASLNRRVTGRRWCGFRYPDHVNYFTPASLRGMAARAGFRTRFGLLGSLPTSDNMWALLTPV